MTEQTAPSTGIARVPREVRVQADEGLCRSPYFTHGRQYVARRVREDLRVYSIRDDRGHERITLLDEPCPHFVMPFAVAPAMRGRFRTVEVIVQE